MKLSTIVLIGACIISYVVGAQQDWAWLYWSLGWFPGVIFGVARSDELDSYSD